MGMNTMVMNVNGDSWQLESELGVVMDGDKPEHLLEAIPVIGRYCDVIGVRAFARFESKEDDYSEKIINQFVQYAGVPVVSMEGYEKETDQRRGNGVYKNVVEVTKEMKKNSIFY